MIWPSYHPCWIIQKSQKCLFEWSKLLKMRFLAIFLNLVHRIDLMLHILNVLNDIVWKGVLDRKQGSQGTTFLTFHDLLGDGRKICSFYTPFPTRCYFYDLFQVFATKIKFMVLNFECIHSQTSENHLFWCILDLWISKFSSTMVSIFIHKPVKIIYSGAF